MEWKDIGDEFEVVIPVDEPVFPMNIVCDLLHMQYYTLHEIMKEGILEEKKKSKKNKKLFSRKDVKRLKYVQYLIEERGVNVKGVKVIFELNDE